MHPEAADQHPINYPVADFGLDESIVSSLNHMDTLEKQFFPEGEDMERNQKELKALRAQTKQEEVPEEEEPVKKVEVKHGTKKTEEDEKVEEKTKDKNEKAEE